MGRGGAATSVSLVVAVLLGSLCVSTCAAFNITKILEAYPDYSQLNDWLTKTGVADEINNRSSLTVLAPSNSVLSGYINGVANAWTDPSKVGDTLRYHVLLTYYGTPELQEIPLRGTSVTTLLQTTGRANEGQGFVTVYNNGTSFLVGHQFADTYGNETILGNVTQSPYVYSILEVSALLTPVAPSLPSPTPAPSPHSKGPPPAPHVTTPTVEGPADAQSTSPNHASTKWVNKLLVLLAMLFATLVALL